MIGLYRSSWVLGLLSFVNFKVGSFGVVYTRIYQVFFPVLYEAEKAKQIASKEKFIAFSHPSVNCS